MESTQNPKKRSSLGKIYQAINECHKDKTKEHVRRQNKPQTLNNCMYNKTKMLYSNVDQLTSIKKTELMNRIEQQKPLIIALCEVKPKNLSSRSIKDYKIQGYRMYPVNLDSQLGRGIAIYIHSSIENYVTQISTSLEF